MKVYSVSRQKVKAHDKYCIDAYRTDKCYGFLYGQVELKTGERVSWERGSYLANFCVYCGPGAPGVYITD